MAQSTRQTSSRPAPRSERGSDRLSHVVLAHGGGGQLTDELLQDMVLPQVGNDVLNELSDSAILPGTGDNRLAMTVDGYVVQPWRFPGGDIGRLGICGTVNDLAVCGAEPMGLTLSLILADGLAKRDLESILGSAGRCAEEANVRIVSGDTKVVGRGQADGVYLTTAGVGRIPAGRSLGAGRVRPDDRILVNGPIGEHGLAVMLAREMPEVDSVLSSDAAPLNHLTRRLCERLGEDLVFMRDPTRSGLAGVGADLAMSSGYHVELEEEAIPVRPEARHAADMLGLDPLEVANEGKVVAVVRPAAAAAAMEAMREDPLGRDAAVIGTVEHAADGVCELRTEIGGRRVLQKPYGEELPRIC